MPTLILGLNQHATVTLRPLDASTPPNTAVLPSGSIPIWQHNGAGVDIVVAADGMSALVTSNTAVGSFTVNVSAQSQPFGPLDVQGAFDVAVSGSPQAGPPVSFGFTFSTPADN